MHVYGLRSRFLRDARRIRSEPQIHPIAAMAASTPSQHRQAHGSLRVATLRHQGLRARPPSLSLPLSLSLSFLSLFLSLPLFLLYIQIASHVTSFDDAVLFLSPPPQHFTVAVISLLSSLSFFHIVTSMRNQSSSSSSSSSSPPPPLLHLLLFSSSSSSSSFSLLRIHAHALHLRLVQCPPVCVRACM